MDFCPAEEHKNGQLTRNGIGYIQRDFNKAYKAENKTKSAPKIITFNLSNKINMPCNFNCDKIYFGLPDNSKSGKLNAFTKAEIVDIDSNSNFKVTSLQNALGQYEKYQQTCYSKTSGPAGTGAFQWFTCEFGYALRSSKNDADSGNTVQPKSAFGCNSTFKILQTGNGWLLYLVPLHGCSCTDPSIRNRLRSVRRDIKVFIDSKIWAGLDTKSIYSLVLNNFGKAWTPDLAKLQVITNNYWYLGAS